MPQFTFYGSQFKTPQQPAPPSYQPWQVDSYNQRMGQEAQARYGAQAAGAQANAQTQAAKFGAQANKDMSAFEALKGLGISGQQAMSNYGIAQQNALVNSQIAQNNFAGQMGTNYYNTLGQGMGVLGGLGVAASQATADSNKAAAVGGLGTGMVNAGLYGAQAGVYGMGNMPNFNFGGMGGFGGGGFRSSGPSGTIASGGYGGGPSVRGGPDRQFNPPPPPPYMQAGGGGGYDPTQPFQQSLPVLQDMLRQMDNPNGMPNVLRQDVNRAFRQTQANLMDPSIINSLNGQMALAYGMTNSMYDKSNYGLNTRDGANNARPRYSGGRFGARFNY